MSTPAPRTVSRSGATSTPSRPAPAISPASRPTPVVRPSAPTSVKSSSRAMARTAAPPIRPAAPATATRIRSVNVLSIPYLLSLIPKAFECLTHALRERPVRPERADRGHGESARVEQLGGHPPDVVRADRVHLRDEFVEGDLPAVVDLRTCEDRHPAARTLQREHQAALEGLLGAVQFHGVHGLGADLVDLVEREADDLGSGVRAHPRVDDEQPAVTVGRGVRGNRVDESPSLPDLLKQPRTHAAAEQVVEQ